MKNKKSSNYYNKTLLVLFMILVTSAFYCCSEEDEIAPQACDYTSEQKQEIQAIAQKYGFKVRFEKKTGDEKLLSMSEVEEKCQFFAKLFSQSYLLSLVKEGEVSTLPNHTPYTRATFGPEDGSWSGRGYESVVVCEVTIDWKIPTHDYPAGSISGGCNVYGADIRNYTPQVASFQWASPNYSIDFIFKGDVHRGKGPEPIEVRGHVNVIAGTGQCYFASGISYNELAF